MKEWGDGEKQRGVFKMTDYNTMTTRSSTKTTVHPLTLPVPLSHCTRLMTTERSCLINMYSLLLFAICCTVFLFSLHARSFPCLYVTNLLICESRHAQNPNQDSRELRHVYGTAGSVKTKDLWCEEAQKCKAIAVLRSAPAGCFCLKLQNV